mmetsp:Transcript_42852/g.96868  ORF Transcript_42852/g.96868 Transcript_42852/m.96868 type:complete len:118 (-) Transcript_42852:102-455(-)
MSLERHPSAKWVPGVAGGDISCRACGDWFALEPHSACGAHGSAFHRQRAPASTRACSALVACGEVTVMCGLWSDPVCGSRVVQSVTLTEPEVQMLSRGAVLVPSPQWREWADHHERH